MKFRICISVLFFAGFIVSCDRADSCDPVPVMDASSLSDATPLDKRIKEVYEKYNVLFKYDFEQKDYEYNWTESLSGMPYTPAVPEYGIAVINAVEKLVFGKFPEGFIREYLQPNILLVDSVEMEFVDENWDDGSVITSWYTLPGNISKNNITVALVNKDFKEDAGGLEDAWISLFIERMMFNTNFWPFPAEFAKVNGGKTGTLGAYWSGNYEDIHMWFNSCPEGHISENFEWWTKGLLKPGRLGCANHASMMGGAIEMFGYWKGTIAQDFGDYAAFIVTKTPAEKEAFWQEVQAKAPIQGYNAVEVLEMMKKKVELVQQYFKTNFGFELSEPQQ